MEPNANGAILGAILQLLPTLLPIIQQILAGLGPKPTTKVLVLRALAAHAQVHPSFDLGTILANLPQIEAVIEQILQLVQTFGGSAGSGGSGGAPVANDVYGDQPPMFSSAPHFGGCCSSYAAPKRFRAAVIDPTTIQADFANLTAIQTKLDADTGLDTENMVKLTDATTAKGTSAQAVLDDTTQKALLVKQLIADATALWGPPAA